MKKGIYPGIVAIAGLLLTLMPSLLVFSGRMPFESNKTWMTVGMLLWFVAAPFWIKRVN
jgi:hypothetical protein